MFLVSSLRTLCLTLDPKEFLLNFSKNVMLSFTLVCAPSHVQHFVTLWTTTHQDPLSMGFSRREYWSGLSFPPPGDLPDPGTESPLTSPAWAGRFFTIGFPCGSVGKESTCNTGNLGLIPGLGRSPGEGKGYPLQYSGLENSMDCIVTKSQTWLSDFHSGGKAPPYDYT